MNSDRFEVQQVIEKELECPSPDQIKSFKAKFEALSVTTALQEKLEEASKNDAAGLYFKAILSISEAIQAISKGRHSWSIVKMYYAAFYLTRCIFLARSLAVVKCAGIYTIEIKDGSKPIKRDTGKFRSQSIRGDHITTLATYVSDIGKDDKILSNKILEQSVFEWLMTRREEVHYRIPTFHEPEFRSFEETIQSEGKLTYWIETYLEDDDFIFCFLENHCGLATPLKFAQQASSELKTKYPELDLMTRKRSDAIKSILSGTEIPKIAKFRQLIEV